MVEWITDTMNSLGYWGIGLLMFLENLFPPIPSELIMPLAGFTVAQGEMDIVPAIAAGVIGTMVGALPWYYIGKFVGEERVKYFLSRKYVKWLGISAKDIDTAKRWFYTHGNKTVFFCRMVPGVRTLISLPAGFSEMPMIPFLIYSTLGTLGWVGLLTYAGFLLGDNYEVVDKYLGVVSKVVVLAIVVAFVVWVVRHQRKRSL
jgi:membrane protein DedA with SNARE-associated domain